MRFLVAFALVLAACTSADDDSKTETANGIEFIPAGTYSMSQLVAGGEVIPQDTTQNSVVVSFDGDKTRFEFRGTISDGNQEYSCQPRVWTARVNANGATSDVRRPEENCTASLSEAQFVAIKRSYTLTDSGFIEKLDNGGITSEAHYTR